MTKKSINTKHLSPLMVFRRIWLQWGHKHLVVFIIANILMLMVAGTTALYPIVIDYAFQFLTNKDWSKITLIPFAIVILTLIKGSALYQQTVLVNKVVHSIIANIQTQLYESFINLDLDIINKERAGGLQSRIMNDVNLMKEAMIRSCNNLIRDLFTLIGLIVSMIWLNWVLAIAVLAIYPLATFPIILIGKRSRFLSHSLQSDLAQSASFLTESFVGARLIKSYQLESEQKDKASNHFNRLKTLFVKLVSTRAGLEPVMEIVGGIAISLVILLAGWQIISGRSSVGEFSGFISALLIAVGPARALGTLNSVLQEGTAAATRVFAGIDSKAVVIESESAKSLIKPKGNLVFKNVSYSYSDKNLSALNDIDLEILPGEHLAIVGPSGSGKSTLVNLIFRFFDPENGKIIFDDQDIRFLKLSSLRKNIAIVSQETSLLYGSVHENISYGDKTATKNKILKAAIEADADQFIRKLPKGYDTLVGENGENLSGGEKQRISIARAILKNPAVLILDEPTSALDASTEERIKNALHKASASRTTITIAHRISTVIDSDRIVVMDKGKIISVGNHKELFSTCLIYKKMSLLQNIES